jgi:EAL domain-containing protein (putative c-di-GMP-specific phosphodiesterase class I)
MLPLRSPERHDGLARLFFGNGVEHLAQEQAIIAMGCDEVQGFMYAKPMPPSELLVFLRQQTAV